MKPFTLISYRPNTDGDRDRGVRSTDSAADFQQDLSFEELEKAITETVAQEQSNEAEWEFQVLYQGRSIAHQGNFGQGFYDPDKDDEEGWLHYEELVAMGDKVDEIFGRVRQAQIAHAEAVAKAARAKRAAEAKIYADKCAKAEYERALAIVQKGPPK